LQYGTLPKENWNLFLLQKMKEFLNIKAGMESKAAVSNSGDAISTKTTFLLLLERLWAKEDP